MLDELTCNRRKAGSTDEPHKYKERSRETVSDRLATTPPRLRPVPSLQSLVNEMSIEQLELAHGTISATIMYPNNVGAYEVPNQCHVGGGM